jgi:hypothetical protein
MLVKGFVLFIKTPIFFLFITSPIFFLFIKTPLFSLIKIVNDLATLGEEKNLAIVADKRCFQVFLIQVFLNGDLDAKLVSCIPGFSHIS